VKKKTKSAKPKPQTSIKVKDLSPKKDPAGGRKAGDKQIEY
jgi:hypothetical protein